MFYSSDISISDFEKEIEASVGWAIEKGFQLKNIPFVDGNKCSPLGAILLKNNLEPTYESKDVSLIAASNDNFKKLNKNFETTDMQLNSFLLGMYGCPDDNEYCKVIVAFHKLGIKYKDKINEQNNKI
jgi:hypothetical protein